MTLLFPRLVRPLRAALVWSALAWLAACGGGSGGSGGSGNSDNITKTYAYVANLSAGSVSAFEVTDAANGQISAIGGSPFTTGGSQPREVSVDARGRHAYVTNRGSDSLAVFAIDAASGALSPIAGSPFAFVSTPFGFAIHPGGAFAVASSVDDNSVSVVRLDASTGAPTLAAGPYATGSAPAKVVFNASGTLVFVANQASNDVSVFAVNAANATLSPVPGAPFASGGQWVYQLAVHPTGAMLFNVNYQSASMSAYAVDASGALSRIGSPLAAGIEPFGIVINPAGTRLYVASGGSGQIYGYNVDISSRTLTPFPGGPFDSGGTHGLALNATGTLAISAEFGTDTITTLILDEASGQFVQCQTLATGAQPLAMTFAVVAQ
jgi:6-phosphogluconolactonase